MPPLAAGSSTYTRLSGRLRSFLRRSVLDAMVESNDCILARKLQVAEWANLVRGESRRQPKWAELLVEKMAARVNWRKWQSVSGFGGGLQGSGIGNLNRTGLKFDEALGLETA